MDLDGYSNQSKKDPMQNGMYASGRLLMTGSIESILSLDNKDIKETMGVVRNRNIKKIQFSRPTSKKKANKSSLVGLNIYLEPRTFL